jgi:3-dehydroquinate synthase
MNSKIKSQDYTIEFNDLLNSNLSSLLREKYASSKKIILVDENTHDFCLDKLLTNFEDLKDAEIILLPAGEENKVLEICFQVWESLSEFQISRKDLIINLGGGVVTDMGGFIASIYKRGIDFINIPTTLLAMVDASVGGKTGVDLGKYKNQLGVFSNPAEIYCDISFLETLEQDEIKNGFAEMLKHGLISDKNHWESLKNCSWDKLNLELIYNSVSIKNEIVLKDPKERNLRKLLNFGHTFGHAFEGFHLHEKNQIKHGHAVAIGILCESYLSYKKSGLSDQSFEEIKQFILSIYPLIEIKPTNFEDLINLMQQDKKNEKNKILCVLLNEIGKASLDFEISSDEIHEVLTWYVSFNIK